MTDPKENIVLKAFQIGEDLYAAVDAAQAIRLCEEMRGEMLEDEAEELTDAQLDAEQPEFGEDEQPTGGKTSIRQVLREYGDEPGWLAGRWL